MNLAQSKSIWVGALMVVIGILGMAMPDIVATFGLTGDPAQLIGTGVGIITLRLGIAKNGQNV